MEFSTKTSSQRYITIYIPEEDYQVLRRIAFKQEKTPTKITKERVLDYIQEFGLHYRKEIRKTDKNK